MILCDCEGRLLEQAGEHFDKMTCIEVGNWNWALPALFLSSLVFMESLQR